MDSHWDFFSDNFACSAQSNRNFMENLIFGRRTVNHAVLHWFIECEKCIIAFDDTKEAWNADNFGCRHCRCLILSEDIEKSKQQAFHFYRLEIIIAILFGTHTNSIHCVWLNSKWRGNENKKIWRKKKTTRPCVCMCACAFMFLSAMWIILTRARLCVSMWWCQRVQYYRHSSCLHLTI